LAAGIFGWLWLVTLAAQGQTCTLRGQVKTDQGKVLAQASVAVKELDLHVRSGADGRFVLRLPRPGTYTLGGFASGYRPEAQVLSLQGDSTVTLTMSAVQYDLDAVTLQAEAERDFGIRKLGAIEGTAIYAAKKTEVVSLAEVTGNLATNNARQVFAKVAGLNIWESDAAGLQLGIGGRGLSPNRTANFNTRQNGYDIAADALGYPESYYTPPMEALDRIEVIRGAASLQYGPQFGGMVNFVMKEGEGLGRPLSVQSRQTVGSWGLFSSYNSVAGEKGPVHYFAFFQHKQGNGWRPNESFEANTGYASVHYQPTEQLELKLEYTGMHYLAQQAGGLTDANFRQDPRQSLRARNWFQVNWNLAALTLDYAFSPRTRLNVRAFGNRSGRDALGNLARINRFDTVGMARTLILDDYLNAGLEGRLLHEYKALDTTWALLVGGRAYHGLTEQQQGEGSTGAGPDFFYNSPERQDLLMAYTFPSSNYSFFVEHIFRFGKRLSVTPGIRAEHIRTFSQGFFKQQVRDASGGIVAETRNDESDQRLRSILLAGVGLSYSLSPSLELYGNVSQNYRAVTFNDIRITNPNFSVDPDIQDERGYNADLGLRGGIKGLFYVDASLYHLYYRDRIGLLLRSDQPPLYLDYRLRTNVADARTWGVELVGELEWVRLLMGRSGRFDLSTFVNVGLNHARYVHTDDPTIIGSEVELVPPYLLRTGIKFSYQGFRLSGQYSQVGGHYTDATNAETTASAVNGLIPTYRVADLSASYTWRWLTLEAGVNNLTNARYFTRRATGYPGPGIIPAPGRSGYATVGVTF
jgi:Fe(3+) dicitrate transport protein